MRHPSEDPEKVSQAPRQRLIQGGYPLHPPLSPGDPPLKWEGGSHPLPPLIKSGGVGGTVLRPSPLGWTGQGKALPR